MRVSCTLAHKVGEHTNSIISTASGMRIDESRVYELADCIVDAGIENRQRRRTRQEYETIFGITPTVESGWENLELIFKRVIQARANPLNREQYLNLLERVSPPDIINADTHQAAFDALYTERQIGQKITNEFLRHVVDIFGIHRSEWGPQLDVALDTHIVQALVKTGAIVLDDSERDRGPNQIINMNPDSNPRKLIAYQELQDVLQKAAADVGVPRIVFDELWIEHREFINDPLLQPKSQFSDLILDNYQH